MEDKKYMTEPTTKRVMIRIDADLHAKFKGQCYIKQSSIQEVITDLITRWLELDEKYETHRTN